MICPKCKKQIEESSTFCPHCKKVLSLICPKCGTKNDSSVCTNCNYVILSKCTSCGKLNETGKGVCSCGVSTVDSVVKSLTELENFASLTISISNLGKLSKILAAKSLVTKFLYKIKTLFWSFAKDVNGYCLLINDTTFVINFINEKTEYSSVLCSIKATVKLLNIICNLNRTLKKELMFNLEVKFTLEQKTVTDFFEIVPGTDKIKLLDLYTEKNSDAKGLQIIVDQFIYKLLRKEYDLEPLYSTERNKEVVSYYSLNIEKYIVPAAKEEESPEKKVPTSVKTQTRKEVDYEQELYQKSIEGIKVACKFEQMGAEQILDFLKNMNFSIGSRIISLRGDAERQIPTKKILDILKAEVPCYTVVCTEDLLLHPWKFFKNLIEEIFKINRQFTLGATKDKLVMALRNLVPPEFENAEEARLAYRELFLTLLATLPQCVIYVENFNYIDSASLQILEEIFAKIDKTKLSFVVTNSREYALQKYIPDLLNSYYYTEIFIGQMNTPVVLKELLDNEDFEQSFYYKKILDNAGSSFQYCCHAINYLKDCGIIINFNEKVVLTESKTVILPYGLDMMFSTRLKRMSKDVARSLVLAFAYILGPVIEFDKLIKLGLFNQEILKQLEDSDFIILDDSKIYIQNFETIKNSFKSNLKPEVLKYLSSNLLNKVFTESSREYPVVSALEYLEHWQIAFSKLYEISIITLQFGDYDAYLKMCIKLLGLLKKFDKELPEEEISEYQSDFYNNLTLLLYRYAPEKVYPIAESLLQKAEKDNDNEKIKTLSNMMLQGGLLTSNYTNSTVLLQNILERTNDCVLADSQGKINPQIFMLSLVSIEIYFYTGCYDKCITLCEDILSVLSPEKLLELKPVTFTTEQFNSHIENCFAFYILANLLIGNENPETILSYLQTKTGLEYKESVNIIKFSEYLKGGDLSIVPAETLFSKLFTVITMNKDDYAKFGSKAYEYKSRAFADNLPPYVLLGDLLIGYAYKKMNAIGKAEHIYSNVYTKAKQNSLYFITHLASYFLADLNIQKGDIQSALQIITNSITVVEKAERPCILLLYFLKSCFVKLVQEQGFANIDITSECGFIEQLDKKFPGLKNLL